MLGYGTRFVLTLASLLFMVSTVIAEPAINADEVVNDKTGKYVSIESDHPFALEAGWFAHMHCSTPAHEFITIKVGQSLFRLPEDSLRTVLTGALVMTMTPDGKYLKYYRADTGCPENPIEVTLAEFMPAASGPAAILGLKQTPEHEGLAPLAKTLLEARDHPNQNCTILKNGMFVACTGKFNGELASVIMAADKTQLQESGAPLGARCNYAPKFVCGISDDLPGGVSFTAALPDGTLTDITVGKLGDLHKAIRAKIDRLRIVN
ncbi:MAG TPA: hypothetical protein VJP60_01380 [Rhizomicrobium sp.]|nr:hypothetical protein [Rhizomicrobium sp.]